jgi:Flp pilus assembly protein CpaB
MSYRARNIALAIALGLAAVLLVTLYVKNSKSSSSSLEKDLVSVFIASHDIAAGTPGTEMRGAIRAQRVPRYTVVAGAISSKDQVKGLVSTAPILAGQQVTQRQFQRSLSEGIPGEISRTQRAFQLPGDSNQLLVNTLHAGDRVDVISNIKYSLADFRRAAGGEFNSGGGANLVATRLVLRNLLVLQDPEPPAGSGRVGNSTSYAIILRVTDNQAQKLFYVIKNSDWALVLRPAQAAGDSPNSAETTGSILGDGLKGLQFDELINGPQGPQR